MSASKETFALLCDHARLTARYRSILDVLSWDEQTHLPQGAAEYRAEQLTLLAGVVHDLEIDPRQGDWLAELSASDLAADPHSAEGTTIRQLKRRFEKKTKLPKSLVEEQARVATLARHVWVKARQDDDFSSLRPWLERTFDLKRQEAAALGYPEAPYDALLDHYEPGEVTSNVARALEGLRQELVPLIAEIIGGGKTIDAEILHRRYPIAQQEEFGLAAAKALGYDFERGRLDVTAHPFCTTLGPHDVRILTRYDEQYFPGAFFGTLHEVGHGLYEQGMPVEHFGTPPGESVSLGIHESQSRMWENQVGRSRAFWEHFFAPAQRAFPEALGQARLDDFHRAVNNVRPSLIRVEADEATYNLHILARFELEQALIADDLRVADLPGAWNDKYRQYLGITPPNDADGVMQDVHWPHGLVGYFATYSLGNMYAAQFFEQAEADLGGLEAQFRRGEFHSLLGWLRENIHRHGQRYTPAELVRRVTGKPLSHQPLMRHLRGKFTPLYQ